MYLKEFGLHAQYLFNHSRLNSQHDSGGLLGCFMALVLLTLKNPKSNIQVHNHGKQQKLAI